MLPFKSRGTTKKVGSAPGSYISLLVLGDALGNVMFLDADSGTMLHVMSLSEGDYVTKFSFEGSSTMETPLLALGTNSGKVVVVGLTLWQSDVVIAGRKTRVKKDEHGEPLPDQDIPQPPPINSPDGLGVAVNHMSTFVVKDLERLASAATLKAVMKKQGEVLEEGAELELPPPPVNQAPNEGVTALLVYSSRGGETDNRRMIAVGDGTGGLFAVSVNGTLVRNATVRQGYARDIKKQGNSLAVCEELGVGFLSLNRFSFTASFCKGGVSPAESIAVDTLSPGNIYVGFSSGEVVLYNSKAKSPTSKTAVMCSKVQKLNTATMDPAPFSVHSIRGYVIVATMGASSRDDSVLIFNSSNIREMGVRFIAKVSPSHAGTSKCGLASAPLSVSVAPGSTKLPEILVLATSSSKCGGVVTLYEALLTYEPPLSDMSWVRMPMLLGGLVMVFGWQFFKNKSPGRGRGGSEEADIASMMASMGGNGGGGMAGSSLGRGFDSGGSGRRGRY